MAVPNLLHVVQKAHRDFGPLTSHERCGAFGEYCIAILHAIDPNIGHLRKHPGQTQYHGHAVDAALYRATGQVIDIIGSSKIASPEHPAQPAWGVEAEARYTKEDWISPASLPSGDEEDDALPPPPKKEEPAHVCPVLKPISEPDAQNVSRDLNAAYEDGAGRRIHRELLTFLLFRYLREDFSIDDLMAEARRRGIEEA